MHSTDSTYVMTDFPARVAVRPSNSILAGESDTCLGSLTAAVNTVQATSVVTSVHPRHVCCVFHAENAYYPH